MTSTEKVFLKDGEVALAIESLVEDARKWVLFVSPYLKLWGHIRNAIELAGKRNLDMTFVIRSDIDEKALSDIQWLKENKVKVLVVEGLHAKIYLNESETVVSSMNLTEYSTQNSHEIGLRVRDPHYASEIKEYVSNIRKLAKPFGELDDARPLVSTNRRASVAVVGRCIRCGGVVELNPNRPLCEGCYEEWDEYGNEDYPEKFCHFCGRPANVTYAKPLCRSCYSQLS